MKKLLLLLMATAILFSMSSVFVYADFAADATVQSYDFENKDDVSMFAKSDKANIRTKLHSTAGVGNSSTNMLRIQSGASAAGYARFISFLTEYSKSTNNLFELEMKLLKKMSDNSNAKVVFSTNSNATVSASNYTAGALVFTKNTIEWWPNDDQAYKFTADISQLNIPDEAWFNVKILGNTGTSNSFGRASILINDTPVTLTCSADIDTFVATQSYTVFPMRTSKNAVTVRSFNIQYSDPTQEGYLDIDDVKNAPGDGFIKLKNIEDQSLNSNEVKSIDLSEYFFNYNNSELEYSIDEKFGTIENGVLTFNTTTAISDVATLTAGNKELTFNYTVKGSLDNVSISTAERAFSSNDGESITVDSVTYSRYAMLVAKAPEVAGYTLKEYGVLLMANESPYITTENVIKGVADKAKTTNDGSYGILFEGSGIQSGVKYYLRPYAIYVDSEGKATNKYGNARTVTLND